MRLRHALALAAAGALTAGAASIVVALPAQADPLTGAQLVLTNVTEVFSVSAPDRFVHTEFDATLPAGGSGTVRISTLVKGDCATAESTVVDTLTISADGHYADDLQVPYTGFAIIDVDASDGTGSSAPQEHTELGVSALDVASMTAGDFGVSFTPASPPNSGTVGFDLGEVGPAGGDFDIAVDGAPLATDVQVADCAVQYVPWSAVADGSTIAVSNHSTHEVLASYTVARAAASGSSGSGSPAASASAPSDPVLAETGVNIEPWAVGGVGLLAAGALVIGLTLRRRRAS